MTERDECLAHVRLLGCASDHTEIEPSRAAVHTRSERRIVGSGSDMDKDEADDNDDADDLDEALVAGGKACGKCVGCRDEAADKDMMASDETAAL